MRELTDEEKSKTQKRKQLLAASLEAKKRDLNLTYDDPIYWDDESGEFRVLVDNVSNGSSPLNHMIVEAIGIQQSSITKDCPSQLTNDTLIYMTNREGHSAYLYKKIEVMDRNGSFAVENILYASKKTCEQSPLKDKMGDCRSAELRPLTQEEKAQLDELKGEAQLAIETFNLKASQFANFRFFILTRLDLNTR